MQHTSTRTTTLAQARAAALTLIAAAVLSACGGGGGDPGAVAPPAGSGGGTPGAPTTPPPAATETKVGLVMVDGSGNTVTSLSGGQTATLKATVLTPAGKPAAGAIVQFNAATQGLVSFTPETASALTDANGVAVVTIKPASYTVAGAVAVTATSVVEGKTGTGGVNLSIGAAPLTLGTLAFVDPPKTSLPAFSTLALKIPVSSGGKPAAESTGLVLTSLCVGDGTATLVPSAMNDGIQVATYTNNGCNRPRDIITASIGNSSQTIGFDVSAASIGAIQFSGSSLNGQSIVRKGSGGLGRAEAAQLSFRVVDQQGKGLGGVEVDFSATTYIGGLAVTPMKATTDTSGNVATMVSSGTVPTPVRVMATAVRNGITISGLSDTLVVSTGLPIQKSMSMSAEHYNMEGGDIDGVKAGITVRLADQYGNPVSDGTAINFVTEGGAIGSSAQGACTTENGGCTVELVSQNFRPADGRVTVLALVQGVENFTDVNGDGQYSCAGKPDTFRPLVDECELANRKPEFDAATQDMGDPFLDTNLNGSYEPELGDLPFPFKGSTYQKDGNGAWGVNYLRDSLEMVFSGSYARIIEVCRNGACTSTSYGDGAKIGFDGAAGASCAPQLMSVRLTDGKNNPLPFGTAVAVVSSNKLAVAAVSPATIPSTVSRSGTIHQFTVTPDATCAAGDFTLQTKTPTGKITEFKFTTN